MVKFAQVPLSIHPARISILQEAPQSAGPVVYWMSREQRVSDNAGLLYAQNQALASGVPLVCVFCLVPEFLGGGGRHYDFMLRGLEGVEHGLERHNIAFYVLEGDPGESLPPLLHDLDAGMVVTDFDPLRIKQQWQQTVRQRYRGALHEVDGHNVVPCRFVSDKKEIGARTLRAKIGKLLPDFMEPLPVLRRHPHAPRHVSPPIDWGRLRQWLRLDDTENDGVPAPGEQAALAALERFVEERLPLYAAQRNDPNAGVVSRLSAYFHFGQLAPLRAALSVLERYGASDANAQAWLEELIVRRELADNYCFHERDYDRLEGLPGWAQDTLDAHSGDRRNYVYEYEEFASASTHSPLWNAAQRELLRTGFMHGYMRMFWAKKILEWSVSPREAIAVALELNNRYQLDGRDPNGFVGVLWSIGGLHDRPWKERPVYGKIRYMNANGCRRKFDAHGYVERWLGVRPASKDPLE